MQKVCIAVPGVRPLPHTELGRRQRAVELIRSGTSEAFATYLACSLHLAHLLLCTLLQCMCCSVWATVYACLAQHKCCVAWLDSELEVSWLLT